jgi:hypothetical protein
VTPRCSGESLLGVDCNSAYSQGVRMYIVSKYRDVVRRTLVKLQLHK